MTKLSILVPAYNEARTIAKILDKLIEAPLDYSLKKEIVIINDGSSDLTGKIID